MLEHVILGMVCRGELTGYEMKKHIEQGVGMFTKASFGSLYPALTRLEEKGCIAMTERPNGNRKRKYYAITEAGRAALMDWLTAPVGPVTDLDGILLKVFFFDLLPVSNSSEQLQRMGERCEQYRRDLLEEERRLHARLPDTEQFYYKMSTLYYGISAMSTAIKWIERIGARMPLRDLIRDVPEGGKGEC